MALKFHGPTREGLSEFQRSMRTGIGMYTDAEREKRQQERQDKIRAEAKLEQQKKEEREEQEFTWKKEDREKKDKYDYFSSELDASLALYNMGEKQAATQRVVEAYNKSFPDGNQIMALSKSSIPPDQWDKNPELKGKEVAIISRFINGKPYGKPLPIKTYEDLFKLVSSKLKKPGVYSKAYDNAQAKVSELNLQQKQFIGKDGKSYRRNYKVGFDGSPIETDPVLVTAVTPASEMEKRSLFVKKWNEENPKNKFSPEETKSFVSGSSIGVKSDKTIKGKKTDVMKDYKQRLDILGRAIADKMKSVTGGGSMGALVDEEGNSTETGRNILTESKRIIRKASSGEKLTDEEKDILEYARDYVDVYDYIFKETVKGVIGERKKPTKRTTQPGSDWRQYRRQQAPIVNPNTDRFPVGAPQRPIGIR